MAKSERGPVPDFHVSDEAKEEMASQLVAQSMFGLERMADRAGAPVADDFLDVLGRAYAAMLGADTSLNTPEKERQAAEAISVYVQVHLKRYRKEKAATGRTAFQRMLNEFEIPEEMKRAWNDS